MSSILAAERALYEEMWAVDSYADHAPGEMYLPIFLEHVPPTREVTVLDAGAGSGKGAAALHSAGFDVRLCDVTPAGLVDAARTLPFYQACLWHDLSAATMNFGHWGRSTADYVYCTDVLEHVPPQFTMLAIDQMLRVTKHALFLTVSLVPDNFGIWAGKHLHQTVQPFAWWKESLAELGTVLEARDLLSNAVFFVEGRKR